MNFFIYGSLGGFYMCTGETLGFKRRIIDPKLTQLDLQ